MRPLANPIAASGGLVILQGNLAPDGAVVKVAGYTRRQHRGPARVFECEEAAFAAVQAAGIAAGDVIVIRNEGPRGGPGMREMLGVTAAVNGAGLGDSVALVTDGRFSGATRGLDGGARVARGCRRMGRLAPSRTATSIEFDIERRALASALSAGEVARRVARAAAGRASLPTGVLGRYARLVSSAAIGAVLE